MAIFLRSPQKRREFLATVAKHSCWSSALPLLLKANPVLGIDQAINKPKRLLILYSSCGQFADDWYPQEPTYQQVTPGAKIMDIRGTQALSRVFDGSFQRFYGRMNLIRGLDQVPTCDIYFHNPQKILNAQGSPDTNCVTIDQIIGNSPGFYPVEPQFRYFHMGLPGQTSGLIGDKSLCVRDAGSRFEYIQPIRNLALARQSVAGVRNPKVFELLKQQYATIAQSRYLSADDKARFAYHYRMIKDLPYRKEDWQRQLSLAAKLHPKDQAKGFASLVAHTLKTGASNLGVFELNPPFDLKVYDFLPNQAAGFHATTHNFEAPGWREAFHICQQWHASIVRQILEELDEVEYAADGSTYLDNSLVMWVSEATVKNTIKTFFNAHAAEDLPVALWGNLGGTFKTGQYINYQRSGVKKLFNLTQARLAPESYDCQSGGKDCYYAPSGHFPDVGRPLNEFLVTVMRAMGVGYEEFEAYNTDGGQGFGRYDGNDHGLYDLSDRRRELTEILA